MIGAKRDMPMITKRKNLDPGILVLQFVEALSNPRVTCCVVNQDQFPLVENLAFHGIDCPEQKLQLRFVNGDDNGKEQPGLTCDAVF